MTDPSEQSGPPADSPMNVGSPSLDANDFLASLASIDTPHDNDVIVPPGQRSCPICGARMQSQPCHAIAIDVCQDHGIWLDSGKLESLTQNITVSDTLKQRRDLEKMRNREKTKGMLFGWISLFLD